MAVIRKLRARGRQLACSAITVTASIAVITPLITTSAIVAGGLILVGMALLTAKNLEKLFPSMLSCFQGAETEANWIKRQRAVDELRRFTKTNLPRDSPNIFFPGIRSVSDCIIKAAESLRTTLSAGGCGLIKDLVTAVGPSLDPILIEKFLQPMITLCGHTKTLNRKNGDEAVLAIVGNTLITHRVLQHITASSQNIHHSTRMCTAKWVKVIIEKNEKIHCEQHGGLDLIDRCIRAGLTDAKLDVREPMRDTYWTFARVWPDRAESIMSALDAKAQKTLNAHPNKPDNHPNPAKYIQFEPMATSSSTVTPGPAPKLSIKEIKLAAMRAKAAEKSASTVEEPIQDNTTQPKAMATSTVIPGPAPKLSIKEIKLAAMRAKAAEKSASTETETSHAADEVLPGPMAPPRSVFTVTVGGPSQPTLSAPPKRRARTPAAVQIASISRPATPEQEPVELQPTETRPVELQPTTIRPVELQPTTIRPVALQPTEIRPVEFQPTEIRPVEFQPTEISPVTAPTFATAPISAAAPPLATAPPRATARRATPLHAAAPAPALPAAAPVHAAAHPPSVEVAPNAAPPHAAAPLNTTVPGQFVPLPPFQRDPVRVDEQENYDTTTHKHTWNNKEAAQKRRSISPLSRDPAEARLLLDRGINRIVTRTIDDHGYRSLQGLIIHHDRIFKDEDKFDYMLLALLDALETPNTEARVPLGRPLDNKFQILVTIRLMFVHNRKYFSAYFPRAMCALILARRNFESRNHIVSGLEETAKDIAAVCSPPDVIDAVLDVLETEHRDDAGSRSVAMGLHILSLLSARERELLQPLEKQQEQRMASFGLKCLREPKSIVRRATIEYCLQLKRIIRPEPRFWALVTGNDDDLRSLITYYAANTSS